jgi:hypothetical protein
VRTRDRATRQCCPIAPPVAAFLIVPTGLGKEQVINAREFAHAFPKEPLKHRCEVKVTVMYSVEYMA